MKQPAAIIPLFFTEMWERFGYYAIQGMLVLFLVYQLNYSTENAFILLAEFVSWIYIAPLFGGLLADQILGYRYSILSGAAVLCTGYMLLAFKGGLFLHLSLAMIIVGNGLLKPNSASFLGKFYYHDDPRLYSGFTFYFIGINVGGLISVLLTSLAFTYIGYHTAFGIVAFGMLIAIAAYSYGFRYFENRGMPINRQYMPSAVLRTISHPIILFMLLLIVIQVMHFLLHTSRVSEIALLIVTAAVILRLFHLRSTHPQISRNNLSAVSILTASSIVFWSLQLQIFFSILLFTTHYVQRIVFGVYIPAPLFVILEPAFILLLGPLLAKRWETLSNQRTEPTPPVKFALGLLFAGLSMLILALGSFTTPSGHLVNPLWIVLLYIPLTLAGLLIAPTGMAMISEFSPKRLTGFMMGIWYMVIGFGGLMAGKLARLTLGGGIDQYTRAFVFYALLGLATSSLLFVCAPRLKKLMRNEN